MNKEKMFQLISALMDKGASISVHMTQYDESGDSWKKITKEEAQQAAAAFQEAIGAEEIKHDEGETANHFVVKKGDISACFSYYPYMIDDLTYEEVEESA